MGHTAALSHPMRQGHDRPPGHARGQVRRGQMALPSTSGPLGGLPGIGWGTLLQPSPSPEQLITGARRMLDGLESLVRTFGAPGVAHAREAQRHGGRCTCGRELDCDCRECRDDYCEDDSCACECCIYDVDVVVRARLGEQRILPLVVENQRRREREVTFQLSEWTTRGGRAAPVTGLVTPEGGTIAPCGELAVLVAVRTTGTRSPEDGAEERNIHDMLATGIHERRLEERVPDVDECLVAYADLRITGCERRPLRIAVAVLPRDCEAVAVSCGCGCC
jgi:hypothetical protein